MTIEEIKSKLYSKNSNDRKRAAKEIGKQKITQLGDELFAQYLEVKKSKRTWETQVEMIKTFGKLDYKKALNEMENIVIENLPHDAITIAATTTFIQLKRNSTNDGQLILELLKAGSVSVINGALYALAIDNMIPNEEIITQILEKCRDINKHKDRIGYEFGLLDSRLYLASACANWNKKITTDFLNHCIQTAYNIDKFGKSNKNVELIEVCENSLKGKVSKSYFT